MDNHPIESLMRTTMESIRDMVDVNTIVGDPVESKDGSIIIPISKVCFGFASGGSEFMSRCGNNENATNKLPFGGGAGAGVTVRPVAFLVQKGDSVRILSVDAENTYDRLVDSIPQIIDMFKGMGKKKDNKENESSPNNQNYNENNDNTCF